MSLNVAAQGLITNQAIMGVIGHNIANANTVGYTRQTVSLEAVAGQKLGNGYFGKGVEISGVKRTYDTYLARQANATQTVASADEARFEKMQQVEALFPLGVGSLGSLLNTSLNAWVDVQSSPADSTARQVVIDKADEFAARIRDTYARLEEVSQTARLQSAEVVRSINQLAVQIADLNDKVAISSSTGVPPNDLLDQRDLAIAELNKLVKVTTIPADDGTLTVFVASSQPLVMGNRTASLEAVDDPADPQNRVILNFVQGSARSKLDMDMVGGGEIKGLQQFINDDLTDAFNQMGRLALAYASEANAQQRAGLNMQGGAGTELFGFGNTVNAAGNPAFAYSGIPGGTLVVSVSNTSLLEAEGYEVTMTGAATADVRRISDGSVVATGQPIATAMAAVGLSLENSIPASLAAGQVFRITPTKDAGSTIAIALSLPQEVAAASRILVTQGSTNTGSATIEGVSLHEVGGTIPQPPATVPSFTWTYNAAAGRFDVAAPVAPASITVGVTAYASPALAPLAFRPGQPMTFTYADGAGNSYSYELTLRGQPANNDQFVLQDQSAPAFVSGVKFNAGNAKAMLDMRDTVLFDGTTTLADGYVAVFSSVASTVNDAKVAAQFSAAQAESAENQRANVAGVNLDEEASKLIQYQQGYQAAAKYMSTVQSLFDTLMSAFR